MRLLELKSGRPWQFKYVEDPRQIHYAVLSHVWNKPTDGSRYVQEITYVEINPFLGLAADDYDMKAATYSGSDLEKLSRFCRVAWDDGFTLVWADMCCIDKSSSAELAEAISSMYSWYRHANVCYAYLKDVLADFDSGYPGPESSLISSNWFTRGWTLQELIAPPVLVFLSTDWRPLGTKALLANHINFRTSIPSKILTHEQHIHEISVAQRLSWAADRNTTKVEDQAYCLMGLFGIHIPVIYGEGSYAFVRLQEEILRRIPDPTLLAWGPYGGHYSKLRVNDRPSTSLAPAVVPAGSRSPRIHISLSSEDATFLFAASPAAFDRAGRGSSGLSLRPQFSFPHGPMSSSVQMTSFQMLRLRAPLVRLPISPSSPTAVSSQTSDIHLALLGCETYQGKPLALVLTPGRIEHNHRLWKIGAPNARIVTLDEEDTSAVSRAPIADIHMPRSAAPHSQLESAGTMESTAARYRDTLFLIGRQGVPSICLERTCAVMALACHRCLLAEGGFARSCAYHCSMTLPDDMEFCHPPDMTSITPSDSLRVLQIALTPCLSTSCPRNVNSEEQCALRCEVGIEGSGENALRDCTGEQDHLSSWTRSPKGVATRAFSFEIRRHSGDPEGDSGVSPTTSSRGRNERWLVIKVSLRRASRELPATTPEYYLSLEIGFVKDCAEGYSAATSPARGPPETPSPWRVTPNRSQTNAAGPSPLVELRERIFRPRSNSISNPSLSPLAATPTVAPMGRQRSNSIGVPNDYTRSPQTTLHAITPTSSTRSEDSNHSTDSTGKRRLSAKPQAETSKTDRANRSRPHGWLLPLLPSRWRIQRGDGALSVPTAGAHGRASDADHNLPSDLPRQGVANHPTPVSLELDTRNRCKDDWLAQQVEMAISQNPDVPYGGKLFSAAFVARRWR